MYIKPYSHLASSTDSQGQVLSSMLVNRRLDGHASMFVNRRLDCMLVNSRLDLLVRVCLMNFMRQ